MSVQVYRGVYNNPFPPLYKSTLAYTITPLSPVQVYAQI